MKRGLWIILLLMLLLLGVFLLHPLVRFTLNLHLERFDRAETVYLAGLRDSERLEGVARAQLRKYVTEKKAAYLDHALPFDQVMSLLSPLTETDLPQGDIAPCIEAIQEMESARTRLAQADESAGGGDLARAIPLYRQSLIADEGAAFRLQQAEIAYKNQVLGLAEAAMDAGLYDEAEARLMDGQALLGADEDISLALGDVRQMQADEAYAATVAEARRLLREDGPEAAFRFAESLRSQAPDAYEYEYIEQLVRYEYEEDLCAKALALRENDPAAACALLEEGLTWLDSERMRALKQEIRAVIPNWLVDMPVLRDETADPRTGEQSSIARDEVLLDALSNAYSHSFWADLGSLTISLAEGFDAFTGTVAFPLGEASDIYRSSATLQVYGDDVLIAEFKDIDGASAPLPFSIPLNGVGELKLVWTSKGANGWKDWGRFATIFDGRLIPPGGQ